MSLGVFHTQIPVATTSAFPNVVTPDIVYTQNMPGQHTTRRTTPLIWPLLAGVILWAGIALLAWLLWNGRQITLRTPQQNLVYPLPRTALAEIHP